MQTILRKKPNLFAFDLDGTLLNSKKELTDISIHNLQQIFNSGSKIAFASGRLKSSIEQYLQMCKFPISVLSLNGAAVYMDSQNGNKLIYNAPLPETYANYLIDYTEKNRIACNYYFNDKLYAVKNTATEQWINFYYTQTRTEYNCLESLNRFLGNSPSKIIFVGPPDDMDRQQHYFSQLWGDSVYICRTWDYYLEFLNPKANKGLGLAALAQSYHISIDDVISFGDAENDIPMLKTAGFSIAVQNASQEVKDIAQRVSPRSNDENMIASEWEFIKKTINYSEDSAK